GRNAKSCSFGGISVGFCPQLPQNCNFSASCTERGPPIWYSGLRPPLWPPLPSQLFSVYVECPNRSEVVYRAAKIGVVEDVEHVRARMQRKSLAELEPPLQRQIDLR